jgi:hypothetical protein
MLLQEFVERGFIVISQPDPQFDAPVCVIVRGSAEQGADLFHKGSGNGSGADVAPCSTSRGIERLLVMCAPSFK